MRSQQESGTASDRKQHEGGGKGDWNSSEVKIQANRVEKKLTAHSAATHCVPECGMVDGSAC